jgi:hypothetical protein
MASEPRPKSCPFAENSTFNDRCSWLLVSLELQETASSCHSSDNRDGAQREKDPMHAVKDAEGAHRILPRRLNEQAVEEEWLQHE